VRPRRLALKFDPPMLVVEYGQGVGAAAKVYQQRIQLKSLSSTSVSTK
jgi:hypothetical protein